MPEPSHLELAAQQVDNAMKKRTDMRLSEFDPTWLMVLLPILTELLTKCIDRNNPQAMRRLSRRGRGLFSRFFGQGRQAREAVAAAVESKLKRSSGRRLRHAKKDLVDAILDVGAAGNDSQYRNCTIEAKRRRAIPG